MLRLYMNTCNVMLPQPLALQFLFYFILKTELLNSIYLSVYYQIEEKKIDSSVLVLYNIQYCMAL